MCMHLSSEQITHHFLEAMDYVPILEYCSGSHAVLLPCTGTVGAWRTKEQEMDNNPWIAWALNRICLWTTCLSNGQPKNVLLTKLYFGVNVVFIGHNHWSPTELLISSIFSYVLNYCFVMIWLRDTSAQIEVQTRCSEVNNTDFIKQ